MMELKPVVWEDKTKQMENEKWISYGQKTGDVDHRTPPEQGEGLTVVTPAYKSIKRKQAQKTALALIKNFIKRKDTIIL